MHFIFVVENPSVLSGDILILIWGVHNQEVSISQPAKLKRNLGEKHKKNQVYFSGRKRQNLRYCCVLLRDSSDLEFHHQKSSHFWP